MNEDTSSATATLAQTDDHQLPVRAIIFDCFGVLVANAFKQRLKEMQHHDPEKAKQLSAINDASDMGILSRQETAEYVAEVVGLTAEDIIREQDQGEVRNDTLIEYITSLKSQFKLAMLSNISDRGRLEIRFQPGQLDQLFDVVVCSGDEGYVKPEPEIYRLTAQRLGVDPLECIMIDDIAEFCDGARQVGMRTVQFFTNEQCMADVQALLKQ